MEKNKQNITSELAGHPNNTNHQSEFDESFFNLLENAFNIMKNAKEVATKSEKGQIEKIDDYRFLTNNARDLDSLRVKTWINKDDEISPELINPDTNQKLLESANTTIKNQSTYVNGAIKEIEKRAKENMGDKNITNQIDRNLTEKRAELLENHKIISDIRELEIKEEKGTITLEEKDKLKELEELEDKKKEITQSKNNETKQDEFSKKRVREDSNEQDEPSKKRVKEDSNEQDEPKNYKPNNNETKEDESKDSKEKNSLLKDFADTSTEPMDIIGGDD